MTRKMCRDKQANTVSVDMHPGRHPLSQRSLDASSLQPAQPIPTNATPVFTPTQYTKHRIRQCQTHNCICPQHTATVTFNASAVTAHALRLPLYPGSATKAIPWPRMCTTVRGTAPQPPTSQCNAQPTLVVCTSKLSRLPHTTAISIQLHIGHLQPARQYVGPRFALYTLGGKRILAAGVKPDPTKRCAIDR